MTKEEIQNLVKLGEGPTLEFKSGIIAPDLIARQISAFANSSGGRVIFGIREPNEIVGIDERRLQKSVERARLLLSGNVKLNLNIAQADGKKVGVLSIEPAKGPVAADGGYYQRTGEIIHPMMGDQIKSHFDALKEPGKALSELSTVVARQTQIIEQLQYDFQRANSPRKKILLALGGAAGGALVKFIIEQLLG